MSKKNKNEDSSVGLIVLVLILLGAVGYVYFYEQNKKNEQDEPVVAKKEESKYSDDDYAKIYNQIALDLSDENNEIKKGIAKLETEVTSSNISDDLKIVYSMNNMYNEYLKTDSTKRNAVNNYVYTNKYVETSKVNFISELYFGTKVNPKSVVTNSSYYLYDSKKDIFYIYKKKFDSKINKETYYTGSYDDNYIYIDEFVAYTNTTTEPMNSYTYHNNLLPIDINKDNINENLDIIDHFKYTFKYLQANKVFQLVKIEYIKPNE